MKTLLIATSNEGKLREMQTLLQDLPYTIVSLVDLPDRQDIVVEETASTFEGNALIKAYIYAIRSGLTTLAEDSGLEVDALHGAPGVHSARWVEGSDADRNTALLKKLEGVPEHERTARYRTVLAFVDPETLQARTVNGVCEGIIANQAEGDNGFGYDPIFYHTALKKTGGQMTPEEKNSVSHRGEACRKAKELLRQL